jgi:hypothetical protein
MKKQSKLRHTVDLKKILLHISILLFTLFMTSCNSGSSNNNHLSKGSPGSISLTETQNASLDSIVLFLLGVSANDFHVHQRPIPVNFRNVQIRYLISQNAENRYLICGQFLIQDKQSKDEWISFATIRTDPFEQWIGSNALAYCQDSKAISYKIKDLSSELKNRFDSLQKIAK